MFCKTNYFPLLFAFILFFSFSTFYAQLNTSSTPQWVMPQTYEENPEIASTEISYGLLTLLSDEQIHIPKRQRYVRLVRKITDNVGVQDGSSISINYDPSYQQLYLHGITVIRNGKKIDKLNLNDFQTIRKESNSENYIYDGSLNAVANLADIRNGDIVDYSYSIIGFNPIHGNHFSGVSTLNDYQPVGKINFHIISDRKLNYSTLNTDQEPTITSQNGYTSYNWNSILPKAPKFENNSPAWHLPYQHVFVSDFSSWEDVVDWALDVYEHDQFSNELKSKIEQIQSKYHSEGERISAALKFVQDEIRYLGLEDGIGGYKPFLPNKVFNQRYGDCKDKSWLLVNMLRDMDIEAYPVLVNSSYGESLDKLQPSAKAFNHVVVKVVDSTNNDFFYDPTISNQSGKYNSISFPNFGKALVIKKGVDSLEQIVPHTKEIVEVYDTYDLPIVGGPGTLNVMTRYRDAGANTMRARYKSTSLSALSNEFKSYYNELFDNVEVIKDPIFTDDSIYNEIIVEESYRINNIWKPMLTDKDLISVEVSPYSISDVFLSPDTNTRETPFALYYPTHVKHKITVKLPEKWNISEEKVNVNSKSFDYSLKIKMNPARNILYLNYDYLNKKSEVLPADFDDYYDNIKKVEQILGYHIFIPKSEAMVGSYSNVDTSQLISSLATIFYWALGFMALIVIGLVIFVVRNNNGHG